MVKLQGSIEGANWLNHSSTKKLIQYLGEDAIRFVGGAVRDTLLGLDKTHNIDVDVATIYSPEKVTALLENNHVKVIPTGIEHGTVTAVIEKHVFEITTLRKDKETFGRHAKVEFHDDWEEDAKRRDFSLNALYANAQGEVVDYLGGFEDLQAGKIRFIGDPSKRIQEDALRILRFFRFYAHYGKGEIDKIGLQASKALKGNLNLLSVERVFMELIKLVSAKDPILSLKYMEQSGVLEGVLPEAEPVEEMKSLVEVEGLLKDISPIRRLSILLPKRIALLKGVAKRLKFPNELMGHLRALIHLDPNIHINMKDVAIKHALYIHKSKTFQDQIILKSKPEDIVRLRELLEAAKNIEIPIFPLNGRDLIAKGLQPGPEMGGKLRDLENKWIESDFELSKEELLKLLN